MNSVLLVLHLFTKLLLLLLCASKLSVSFPSGAPLSACGHLMPIHEGANLSVSYPPPFIILLSDTNYTAHDTIEVTVSIRSDRIAPFVAFMLQGRTFGNKPQAVGRFSIPPQVTKLLSCYGDNDTLSHSAAFRREAMKFLWHPPKTDMGPVVITGSIAQGKYRFWAVESQPIRGKIPATIGPPPKDNMASTISAVNSLLLFVLPFLVWGLN